jgi:hypothetical protein
VKRATILGKASGLFFISGSILSKGQNIPVPLLSSILGALSLLLYTIGYALWFVSSHFFPKNHNTVSDWYGFAQFKEQYLYSSVIGLVGCTFSMAAFFVPALLLPAAWIFLTSNIMWSIAEYHKYQNPPDYDKEYSNSYQKTYLSYALVMTSISAITALSSSLIYFLPTLSFPLLVLSTLIIIGLNALGVELWLKFSYCEHKPTPVTTSHQQMSSILKPAMTLESTASTEPYHGKSLLTGEVLIPLQKSDNTLELDPTCRMTH